MIRTITPARMDARAILSHRFAITSRTAPGAFPSAPTGCVPSLETRRYSGHRCDDRNRFWPKVRRPSSATDRAQVWLAFVVPEVYLLRFGLAVIRKCHLQHVDDPEGFEGLRARMMGVPLAADVLAEVQALVGVILVVDVLQVLTPVLVLVGGGNVLWFLVRDGVHAVVVAGDRHEVHLLAVEQFAGDHVPAVFIARGGGEHPPVLVEAEEGAKGNGALGQRERGGCGEVPAEDVEDKEEGEQVGGERRPQLRWFFDMPRFGRAYRPGRRGRYWARIVVSQRVAVQRGTCEQELPGVHQERQDRLGEGHDSVGQPRRGELQAAGELDPPQQHGAERRSPVPEPGGEKADHAERADPGEDPYIHRQPNTEVEAHKSQRGRGADRSGEEWAEQQERPEGLEHERAEGQHLEQAGEVKQHMSDRRGELVQAERVVERGVIRAPLGSRLQGGGEPVDEGDLHEQAEGGKRQKAW